MAETFFSFLPDDVVLMIFSKLYDDPRDWARLACVCTRFSSLVRHTCWKTKCTHSLPSFLYDSTPPDWAWAWASLHKLSVCCPGLLHAGVLTRPARAEPDPVDTCVGKRKRLCSHMASGVMNLSREQGGKLLARQFRDDRLYICDWPGCVHVEEKRKYSLFRGVFRDFKRTRVWRTVSDGNRSKVGMGCAFCQCTETWDLHSAFCLRRVFGYHHDGEPVVRAYVCENGHVSGAWTDLPMYS